MVKQSRLNACFVTTCLAKKYRIKQRLISLGFLLLASIGHADVIATPSQTELYLDETFELKVTVTPAATLNPDDIRALESLFTIERQTQSQFMQSINGRSTTRIDYQFVLSPKEIGTLGIPNFRANGEQSQPIFITVRNPADRQDNLEEDAIVLSAEVSTTQPYINQPFELLVEVAYRVNIRNGEISDINPPGFDTEVLRSENFTETRNGRSYNVYQQRIQLTPTTVGEITIPDIRFSTEYVNPARGRFERTARTSQLPPINVRPVPASFPDDAFWLPLTSLSIEDSLPNQLTLNQNEHLDWQVSFRTAGLFANQLPDVFENYQQQLASTIRLYRDSPTVQGFQRIETLAISATEPGSFQFPEIRIPWWNIISDRLEYAVIPAKTLQVIAVTSQTGPETNFGDELSSGAVNLASSELPQTNSRFWQVAFFISLLAWLGTLAFAFLFIRYLIRNQTQARFELTETRAKIRKRHETEDFSKLIRTNDIAGFYQQLLTRCSIENCSLTRLKTRLSAGSQAALETLEGYLFKGREREFTEQELTLLAEEMENALRQQTSRRADDKLRLYPEV